MDETTMRERVAEARVGRLATVTPSGEPHVVVCCFALSNGVIYSAIDAKPKSTLALRRLDNLRANPAASLLVDHYTEDWTTLWWVRVDGTARVLDARTEAALDQSPTEPEADPDAAERAKALVLLTAKYEQYRGNPPPGPVIALDTTTWRCWP